MERVACLSRQLYRAVDKATQMMDQFLDACTPENKTTGHAEAALWSMIDSGELSYSEANKAYQGFHKLLPHDPTSVLLQIRAKAQGTIEPYTVKPFPILDPFVGCGRTLDLLTRNTSAVPYGIELDGYRAKEAKERLQRGKVVHTGYETIIIKGDGDKPDVLVDVKKNHRIIRRSNSDWGNRKSEHTHQNT